MKTILVYGLKNVIGGIENYLMMMYKYLHDDLKFVFVVEEAERFIYREEILANDGELVFLPERHSIKAYTDSLRQLLREYRKKTDTLYVNVGHISFDIIPITIALSEGYRVITHSHSAMQEPIKSFKYRVRQDLLRAIGKARLKHSKVERLAVSKRSGDYLYKGKPYIIVSPGIETEKFRYNEAVRNAMRAEINANDSLVLGFVGRLVAVKNPLFLIDVLHDVKKTNSAVKLLVVGDGELKDEMQKKAERLCLDDNVIFAGEVNNVNDYLQAMDILLAPSLSEGMPIVIMEAQSAGLPCICAKGNFPETIDVTGMVRFCRLNSKTHEWSDNVTSLSADSVNRAAINEVVKKSNLNIENASKRLLEVLS